MLTINRTRKTKLLHIASVRALLKRNGFKIGSWAENGRISGMSNFGCGDLEVKEWQVSTDFESKKSDMGGAWINTGIIVSSVMVTIWKNQNIKDVVKVLEKHYTIEKIEIEGKNIFLIKT